MNETANRGIFKGHCYLCGFPISGTLLCYAHTWACRDYPQADGRKERPISLPDEPQSSTTTTTLLRMAEIARATN